MKPILFLDNEGPCTIGDNAFETTVALARECGLGPEVGERFFRQMSNVDDLWGDFDCHRPKCDPTYSAGHTLKVILPFLLAMGATRAWLRKFAEQSLRVVPNIGEVMANLAGFQIFQVSTSYSFYIYAFCQAVGFDFSHASSTVVHGLDDVKMTKKQRAKLLDFILKVANMPLIEYNAATGEILPGHCAWFTDITQFIWNDVYRMDAGTLIRLVRPVGQLQKRQVVQATLRRRRIPPTQAMYVGDSQTDVAAVQFLEGNGLTMAFNGKGRMFDHADLAYIGDNAQAIEVVAREFE